MRRGPDLRRGHPLRPVHGVVVILGRTGRTGYNLPATIAALIADVALNLVLVPPLEIVGAGIALVASYLVVLALMYGFTQQLLPVPYEWGRLARVVSSPRRWSRRGAVPSDIGLRRPPSGGSPSACSTPWPSSRPVSSPPKSGAGWSACATGRGGRGLSGPSATTRRNRRRSGRGIRGRAHGRRLQLLRRRGGASRRLRRTVPNASQIFFRASLLCGDNGAMFLQSVPSGSPLRDHRPARPRSQTPPEAGHRPRQERARVQRRHLGRFREDRHQDRHQERRQSRLKGLSRFGELPDPGASRREECLSCMGPVDLGRMAGEDSGHERAQGVGPGGQDTDGERRDPPMMLAHVEVAVAVESTIRGRPAARSLESWSWWTAAARGRRARASPRPRAAWRSRTRRSRRRSPGP